MKSYSTPYVIKGLHIKTMRYHYTPIRMAKIQSTDNTKCWWGCGAIVMLILCWWDCEMVHLLWKPVWQFLTKLNICIPYDPAIMLLDIYPNDLKTYMSIKNLPRNVHGHFIYNCQHLEATKISFNVWMYKQTLVHP